MGCGARIPNFHPHLLPPPSPISTSRMTFQHTQTQGSDEHRQSQQLSLERTRPPLDLPGYEPQKFLGAGAYGEVWVAIDRNTGRRVAIKFYTHRGGLDWSLLTREVEKLVLLSTDRYVVQLFDVGWDANPPYYVMEYLEQGSLEDLLRQEGTLPTSDAVSVFREVAIGLVHAHGRGVLHCDLKPANVLLDQDSRPRLADFGQSRLSHEQDPALGTLFYMAPEQADLKSAPDARWDVYALGALLYTMLSGAPPHRSRETIDALESATSLDERLARYQKLIRESPPLHAAQLPGIDRALGEILDRCLAPQPNRRFPNPQAVLEALDAREARRARRPLVLLGLLGPALLMLVMGFAAWRGLDTAMQHSAEALTDRALESNAFAAQAASKAVASELERLFVAVEILANDPDFQQLAAEAQADPEFAELREPLSDPTLDEETLEPIRSRFRNHPARAPVRDRLNALSLEQGDQLPQWVPQVASWLLNDVQGLQLARWPRSDTIGRNYGWRSYFQGGPQDMPRDWRPGPDEHVRATQLSAIFHSHASGRWIAGISTPINDRRSGEFLGVLALTVEVGHIVELLGGAEQLSVLVDWREGPNQGLIIQHPLFVQLLEQGSEVPDRFTSYRITPGTRPYGDREKKIDYRDPTGADPQGAAYRQRWLAEMAPVVVRGEPSGLWILVQESHRRAIGDTLAQLKDRLLWIGLAALGLVAVVLTLLWALVTRVLNAGARGRSAAGDTTATSPAPAETLPTIAAPRVESKRD